MSFDTIFLMWLDFRKTGLTHDKIRELVYDKAGVGLNCGKTFGAEGEGFMRINIGCPRSRLKEGLEKLVAVF